MLYVTTRLSSLACVFERFRTASYPMFLLVMFCFMLFVSCSISLWGLGGNQPFPLRGDGHRVPRSRVQDGNHKRKLLPIPKNERKLTNHDPARPHLIRLAMKPPNLREQQQPLHLAIQLQRIRPQNRRVRRRLHRPPPPIRNGARREDTLGDVSLRIRFWLLAEAPHRGRICLRSSRSFFFG